jgi:hypothetical protein
LIKPVCIPPWSGSGKIDDKIEENVKNRRVKRNTTSGFYYTFSQLNRNLMPCIENVNAEIGVLRVKRP